MLMVLAMMMMVLMMMQWSADDRFWQVLQLKFKQRNSIVQPSSKYANKGHKYIIQMWKTANFKISEEKTKAKVTSTKQILHHTKEYASNMQVKFGNEPNDGHRSVSQD